MHDRIAWIEDFYRKAGVSDAMVESRIEGFRNDLGSGTPEQLVERFREVEKAGMTYAITNFAESAFDTSGMELFESAVIPELRGS